MNNNKSIFYMVLVITKMGDKNTLLCGPEDFHESIKPWHELVMPIALH